MGRYFGNNLDDDKVKITPNKFAKHMKDNFGDNYTKWVKEQKNNK